MVRTTIGLLILGLALVLVAARGNAQNGSGLGCAEGQADAPPRYATCEIQEDCGAVGGIACSSGICFCDGGPISPYCACLATGPGVAGAPVVGGAGLMALIALLCAVGAAGLWRRTGPQRAAP
jgi:hypothetical protein